MTKMLICLLVLLCTLPASLPEEEAPIEMSLELSQTRFTEPAEVMVDIAVTNVSDQDMPGPMAMYYPNGEMIKEFGTPTFLAGETRTWQGTWNVTKEQIDEGKVVFATHYTCQEADGSIGRKMKAYYVPVVWINEVPQPDPVEIELAGYLSSGYSWDWGVVNGREIVDVAGEVTGNDAEATYCYTLTGLETGETTICFTYDHDWYEERDPNFARYAIYYRIRVDEELNVSILNTTFEW